MNNNVLAISNEELSKIKGGDKIVDIIDGACTAYATYAVFALAAGVTALGIGTVGAFCAGWKLADLLF